MSTKKVLMLHGYAQNAAIFSKRMGAIRKACAKDIDFVFVDAPHVLQPADLAGFSTSALGAGDAPSAPSPAETPRGWWRTNPERTRYDGVAESLAALRDVLAQDTFEGVFGFSQGAAMAALLAAVLERPNLHPPFLIDGQAPHPPLKFCVSIAGFLPSSPLCSPFFSPRYTTPTLHVHGLADVVAPWRNFFRDYLRDPLGDVPAPPVSPAAAAAAGSQAQSAPVSGAAAPVEAEGARASNL
ncbi:FSH1-domain-containing protein [Phellopilus nigrolimitatus]|nr:FSH1-domain-containing protein [Phellopilus nigrolimitatus]